MLSNLPRAQIPTAYSQSLSAATRRLRAGAFYHPSARLPHGPVRTSVALSRVPPPMRGRAAPTIEREA